MTKIIITQLKNETFGYLKFFLARGIRILPALLFLTAVLTCIGYFLLTPEDFSNYGKHAAASVTFISNLLYYKESANYFSLAGHNKILLHTWSLSVEWQFYMILPFILGIISRFYNNKKVLSLAIFLGFATSLLISYKLTPTNQNGAFYLITTRAWEMLAGGLVFAYFNDLNIKKTTATLLELAGFGLILLCLFIFNSTTPWPGIYASIPVLGSCLILIASRNNSFLTAPYVAQWLGNTSYSVYLWHWPIVFYLAYFNVTQNYIWVIASILASIFLGWLSYRYIETTSRKYLTEKRFTVAYTSLGGFTAVLVVIGGLIYINEGLPGRASSEYEAKTKHLEMPLPSNGWGFYSVATIDSLKIGANVLNYKVGAVAYHSTKKALLFGDSFAGHNMPFWDVIGKKLNLEVHAITTNNCYPSVNNKMTTKGSREIDQCMFNRTYLLNNMKNYDLLILAGAWITVNSSNQNLNDFDLLLKKAAMLNKPVVVMASPYRIGDFVALKYKRSVWLNRDFNLNTFADPLDDFHLSAADQKIKQICSKYKNVLFLNRNSLFRSNHMATKQIPYAFDDISHIHVLGSIESAKFFQKSGQFYTLSRLVRLQDK